MPTVDEALVVATPAGMIQIPAGCRADSLTYICDEVAVGRNLKAICREKDVPAHRTVLRWLRLDDEFRQQYLDAYKVLLTLEIPNIISIADDGEGEEVKRDTLRINTRIKLLERMSKEFGVKHEVSVNPMGDMMAFIATRTNAE